MSMYTMLTSSQQKRIGDTQHTANLFLYFCVWWARIWSLLPPLHRARLPHRLVVVVHTRALQRDDGRHLGAGGGGRGILLDLTQLSGLWLADRRNTLSRLAAELGPCLFRANRRRSLLMPGPDWPVVLILASDWLIVWGGGRVRSGERGLRLGRAGPETVLLLHLSPDMEFSPGRGSGDDAGVIRRGHTQPLSDHLNMGQYLTQKRDILIKKMAHQAMIFLDTWHGNIYELFE